jgi:urease accessory protein
MTPQPAAAVPTPTPGEEALPVRGWRARLALEFVRRSNRTVLRRHHEGPLLVQRPFYPEGEVCHVYVIHPPGGVVGGDELALEVQVAERAHGLVTTPAAGKFYRSAEATARLTQQLTVRSGLLEWVPQENIFYPGAQVRAVTQVQLTGSARFFGWEVSCYGLPARSAAFDCGNVRQGFELWYEGRPLLLERLHLDASCQRARWGLAGQAACGTLLAYPASARDLAAVRALAKDCSPFEPRDDAAEAATLVDEVLLVRAMGPRAVRIRQRFAQLWSLLRPALMGREVVAPRIWAT